MCTCDGYACLIAVFVLLLLLRGFLIDCQTKLCKSISALMPMKFVETFRDLLILLLQYMAALPNLAFLAVSQFQSCCRGYAILMRSHDDLVSLPSAVCVSLLFCWPQSAMNREWSVIAFAVGTVYRGCRSPRCRCCCRHYCCCCCCCCCRHCCCCCCRHYCSVLFSMPKSS